MMLIKLKKIISYLILILVFWLSRRGSVLAVDNFNENFSNLTNWEILSNGYTGSWYTSDNSLVGSVGQKGNSFIFLKKLDLGTSFVISYDAINKVGVDQELVLGVNTTPFLSFYVINTRFHDPNWNQDGANEVILWRCYDFATNSCSFVTKNSNLGFYLDKDKLYKFKATINSKNLGFYIDDANVLNYSFDKEYSGYIGFWNWGGSYQNGVKNVYQNFSVKFIDDLIPTMTPTVETTPTLIPTPTLMPTFTPTLTLTPTETPIPTENPTPTSIPTDIPIPTFAPTAIPTEVARKKKIFVLPGLGASWNSRAIVYGDNVGDGDWHMTPFVNNYDGLTELLDKNGLLRDQDYFVWNYDWRKSVDEIKNKFNSFVNSKNLTSNDDIYLVGHSLGGVVARLWAQENNDNGNIKQVINLGSPNLGALDVYSVWNGGEVLEYDGISSVAFQILLGLQNKGFLVTDLSKIRSFAPVAKDLLPTFDYVLKNNSVLPWNGLSSINNYLADKNNNVSNISSRLTSVVGVGMSTPAILKLGGRSVHDELLGLWSDGELLGFNKNDGDGTVLQNSASFGANNKSELITDHGAIVNDSISVIAEKLGLENKTINFSYSDNFKDSLVVFVGSPATAELKCDSDIFVENNGFILAKNKNYGDCNLTLSPTGNGLVHLVLGNTKENKWNYVEKEVSVGATDVVSVGFSNGQIVRDVNKNSEDFLREQIRFDLDFLGLIGAVSDFDQNLLTKVALRVFEYRKENNERVVSQRILNDLFEYANLVAWDKNQNNFDSLSEYVNSVETSVKNKKNTTEISHNAAVSLALLDDLRNKVIERSGKNLETSYSMIVVLASGYGEESLRD